jgi:hypothetical protein
MFMLKVLSVCLLIAFAGFAFAALYMVATPIRVVNLRTRARAERASRANRVECVCPACKD